ncbi:MAG: NmrA family NAD(P)-binding protein [Gaiellales bacterium]
MAVLLVGLSGDLSAAIAARLLEQGDEVRAVTDDPEVGARLKMMGVKIAAGDPSDLDLIERAATGARTVVVDSYSASLAEALEPSTRTIVISARSPGEQPGADTVVLVVGRSLFGRPRVALERLAAAVDAADDAEGIGGTIVDLTRPNGTASLGF